MQQQQNNNSPSGSGDIFDYIITGAGCAGLSLAMHMIHSGAFGDKKILLVDKDAKTQNDRTWCFWEKENGLFNPVVQKEWQQLFFHSNAFSKQLSILPYKYKLIRGIDFYNYCIEYIKQQRNFTLLQGDVQGIDSNAEGTTVTTNNGKVTGTYIFNSILFGKPRLKKKEYWLLQHFKGWFIATDRPRFDPSVATLMDFRTDQSKGTAFFYVLPFSDREALVEYTLFSHQVGPENEYETALKTYVQDKLGICSYSIKEKEFGVIPMTNYAFPLKQNNIVNIGTAGGQTKGSSGYTFQFIQKHSAAIVKSLAEKGHPFSIKKAPEKFHFYDSVLLNILHNKTMNGAAIFTHLFKKNPPQQVLNFLDNETSLAEDIGIISSFPVLPFAKAAWQHLF